MITERLNNDALVGRVGIQAVSPRKIGNRDIGETRKVQLTRLSLNGHSRKITDTLL